MSEAFYFPAADSSAVVFLERKKDGENGTERDLLRLWGGCADKCGLPAQSILDPNNPFIEIPTIYLTGILTPKEIPRSGAARTRPLRPAPPHPLTRAPFRWRRPRKLPIVDNRFRLPGQFASTVEEFVEDSFEPADQNLL